MHLGAITTRTARYTAALALAVGLTAATGTAAHAASTTVPPSAATAGPGIDDVPCDRHIGASATYRADGATYNTDAQGRPHRAEATNLTRSEANRGSCQRKVGHMADKSGYDGGHLIAATLHGVDRRYDLVPQWASVNRGPYERMEAGAKRCLQAPGGKIVRYRITVTYPDLATVVPDRFLADVTVDTDGHPEQRLQITFPNRALQPAESQAIKNQLDTGLRGAGCTS